MVSEDGWKVTTMNLLKFSLHTHISNIRSRHISALHGKETDILNLFYVILVLMTVVYKKTLLTEASYYTETVLIKGLTNRSLVILV